MYWEKSNPELKRKPRQMTEAFYMHYLFSMGM
jgi:hypothetical protein